MSTIFQSAFKCYKLHSKISFSEIQLWILVPKHEIVGAERTASNCAPDFIIFFSKDISWNSHLQKMINCHNVHHIWIILNHTRRGHLNSLFATFANLHVRKVATFANLHSYTHAIVHSYSTQWSDSHCFWFALCACVINLAFWFFHKIYR